MCGIVGYIGNQNAVNVLMNGLNRLEYRGYDSAGISIFENDSIKTFKKVGKVEALKGIIEDRNLSSKIGIAHTRWATHGEPSDINAHPHSDSFNNISLVHNGIIENYSTLKQKLIELGYTFKSQTDSEVLTIFISYIYSQVKDLEEAVRLALSEVEGTFGIAIISNYEPDKIIAARRGSPMVLGIGDDELILASDTSAIIQYTRQVIYLADNEMVVLDANGYSTKTIGNETTTNVIHQIIFFKSLSEFSGYARLLKMCPRTISQRNRSGYFHICTDIRA